MACLPVVAVCLMFMSDVVAFTGETLSGALSNYETLHHSDIRVKHRYKRDITSGERYHEKDISFDVLNKKFHIRMHIQRGLFSKQFKAYIVNGKNKKTFIDVDRENFLEGHLIGCSNERLQPLGFKPLYSSLEYGEGSWPVLVVKVDGFSIRVDVHTYTLADLICLSYKSELVSHSVEGANGSSQVHAYWEGKDLSATIVTPEDTYVVEPSWRHLPKSERYSMIAYRKSNLETVKKAHPRDHMGTTFCGFVHPDGQDEAAYDRQLENDIAADFVRASHSKSGRWKRGTSSSNPAHDTCTLHLVADYHFYQDIGHKSNSMTANYLVGQLQRVNSVYRATHFQGYSSMGFEIKEMTLYAEPTAVGADEVHHNMAQTTWGTKELLKAFSRNAAFADVCLGHLFTSIAFSDGVLGLGWIASSKAGSVGGLCSPQSGGYYYNTAWSTLKNKYGRRILTQESEIVTTHELGHNWGSQHDPATDECAPSSFQGGNFIMYTYSVSGYEENNQKFSPCSTRTIAAVLDAKSTSCFGRQSASFCGNKQVEAPYEECDTGRGVNDACCGDNCKFKTGATCSDKNSECCANCQPMVAGTLCRDTSAQETTCEGNATCDGSSPVCPANTNKPDGTACIDSGVCKSGQCLSFCAALGYIPCICDGVVQSCLTCCKANSTSTCAPYVDGSNAHKPLADGKPCILGRCASGVCEKLVVQLTDRLWSVIEKLNINTLVVFMKNNIVATCLFLSLLFHIPICLIIACVDWRREKKDKEEIEWHHKENNTLYLDKDQGQIRHTYTRKRPTTHAESDGRRSATSSKTNKVYPQ